MHGWFWFAIGAAAGGGTGGFLPGGGCGAEVGIDVEGADGNAVPLVFLDDDSCV